MKKTNLTIKRPCIECETECESGLMFKGICPICRKKRDLIKKRASNARYIKKHGREAIRENAMKNWRKRYYAKDSTVNIESRVVQTIGGLLKGKPKKNRKLGYTSAEVQAHFKRLCRKVGLNFEDYGTTWRVTYVKKLSEFDLNDPAQYKEACSFDNLSIKILRKGIFG